MAVAFDQANLFQRAIRTLAGLRPISWIFARVLHRIDGPILRLTQGRTSLSSLVTALPVVSLTTTGARSGKSRRLPLIGIAEGDNITILVASNYGQQHHPAWYHNLRANPHCSIQVKGVEHLMVAREADGDERSRLWQAVVRVYPAYALYQQRAGGRRIPIMLLEPGSRSAC